eukprot:CAMPEP_0118871830 /NCGR_PEP_ID=MMETSP1163-20130328/14262_1 /TAXON_ID=124430 /ORGANISM="Phaeomonas parva, Strain CCMP2877" /LENGTH=45 /DNA_ID= /DNA_START= /DNA_END= /DNA_ORIENTATION=
MMNQTEFVGPTGEMQQRGPGGDGGAWGRGLRADKCSGGATERVGP